MRVRRGPQKLHDVPPQDQIGMCYDIRHYVMTTLGGLELLQENLSLRSKKALREKILRLVVRQNKAAVETVERLYKSLCSTEYPRRVYKARASLKLKLLHNQGLRVRRGSVVFPLVNIRTAENGKVMLIVKLLDAGPKELKRIPKKYHGFPVKVA